MSPVNCITMIAASSRKKARVFSKIVDEDTIYESKQELFDDLGGVTKELLIDNPKTLVISNKKGEEINKIESIKEILKDKYFEIILAEKNISLENISIDNSIPSTDLIRETSYYEGGQF